MRAAWLPLEQDLRFITILPPSNHLYAAGTKSDRYSWLSLAARVGPPSDHPLTATSRCPRLLPFAPAPEDELLSIDDDILIRR